MQSKGTYVVQFDRDVSQCARVATIGGAYVLDGEGAGFILTALIEPTTVRVQTTNTTGTALDYHSFSLAVFC